MIPLTAVKREVMIQSLVNAAARDNADEIRDILEKDRSIIDYTTTTTPPTSALQISVSRFKVKAVKELVAAGASVNIRLDNPIVPTLLHSVVDWHGHDQDLLQANFRKPDEGWPECGLILSIPEQIALLLIAAGANIDATNSKGKTPLDMAEEKKLIRMEAILQEAPSASLLLSLRDRPFSVDLIATVFKDSLSCDTLHTLSTYGTWRRLLYDECRDPELSDPVTLAVWRNDYAELRSLLQKGQYEIPVRLNAKDSIGWTKLHIAARAGRTAMVKALVEAGAKINAIDQRGCTALYHAVEGTKDGDVDTIATLISLGANVNKVDESDLSPLHVAAFKNDAVKANVLLNASARTTLKDELMKLTPLGLAQHCKSTKVEALLKKAECPGIETGP